jgi:hypothetical protein
MLLKRGAFFHFRIYTSNWVQLRKGQTLWARKLKSLSKNGVLRVDNEINNSQFEFELINSEQELFFKMTGKS